MTSVSDIRDGKYRMPKDKPLEGKVQSGGAASYASDDDLPF